MQVKLLRVLQEKKFTPVGSNREISVDVRIIAASHKPFEKMIKDGSFREDLFYRLNVLPVYLPPLRERQSDIPHLVNYYLDYFNRIHNLNITKVDDDAIDALKNYSWPGNIRELRNTIEHAFIMESGETLSLSALPTGIKDGKESDSSEDAIEDARIDFDEIQSSVWDKDPSEGASDEYQFTFATKEGGEVKMDFQVAKDRFEHEFIIQALKLHKGKINQTALNANIPKKTLLRKIEKYEINPKDYY
jgi:two-component system response regulator HydG